VCSIVNYDHVICYLFCYTQLTEVHTLAKDLQLVKGDLEIKVQIL